MTTYSVGPVESRPVGTRVVRIICGDGGGVIAWILRAGDALYLESKPVVPKGQRHTRRKLQSPVQEVVELGHRDRELQIPCTVCGPMAVRENTLLHTATTRQGVRGTRELTLRSGVLE